MNSVWIVFDESEYEPYPIGVFSSEKVARAVWQAYRIKKGLYHKSFEEGHINEYEIDRYDNVSPQIMKAFSKTVTTVHHAGKVTTQETIHSE